MKGDESEVGRFQGQTGIVCPVKWIKKLKPFHFLGLLNWVVILFFSYYSEHNNKPRIIIWAHLGHSSSLWIRAIFLRGFLQPTAMAQEQAQLRYSRGQENRCLKPLYILYSPHLPPPTQGLVSVQGGTHEKLFHSLPEAAYLIRRVLCKNLPFLFFFVWSLVL